MENWKRESGEVKELGAFSLSKGNRDWGKLSLNSQNSLGRVLASCSALLNISPTKCLQIALTTLNSKMLLSSRVI